MNVNSNDNLNGFPNSAFSNGTMKQEVIGSVDGINSLEPVDEMNIDKYVDSNSLDPQQQSVNSNNNAGYDNNNGMGKPQDQSFNNFGANSNFNSNSQFDNNSFNYNENLGSIENNKISMELDDLQQQPHAKIDNKDLLSNISDNSLLNNNTNTNGNITNNGNNTQWADEKIESKPTYMEVNFTNENNAALNDENMVFDPSNNTNSNGNSNNMNNNNM